MFLTLTRRNNNSSNSPIPMPLGQLKHGQLEFVSHDALPTPIRPLYQGERSSLQQASTISCANFVLFKKQAPLCAYDKPPAYMAVIRLRHVAVFVYGCTCLWLCLLSLHAKFAKL